MYSTIKNVQYLVAMLKEKNIRNVVISPGNSHNAIVRSIETDDFFTTYNIVDERSAAFFACGIIQQTCKPAAICCTAGTAVSNYLTGVTEASRRELPLIVISADKNPYYLAQYEDQMIEQKNIFGNTVRYCITLPMIKDKKDEWYCQRVLNEAFLEMNHHGRGPIHINVPIEEGMFATGSYFNAEELPKVNIIERIDMQTDESDWQKQFNSLSGKKVMIIWGQSNFVSERKKQLAERVFKKYNCIFATDKLSNLHTEGALEISRAAECITGGTREAMMPDVIISLEGNTALNYKFSLKGAPVNHWIINSQGRIADPFRKLSVVFECSTEQFLEKMAMYGEEESDKAYYNVWKKANDNFIIPDFEFSNLYTVKKLLANIPENSLLNIGNSTTIRISQYFDVDPSVETFCNRGVNGIDGCMSAFIGQSAVTDKLSFLIIGDLTFFYDMNAIWNRYSGKNIRIMLNNNGGAALFHFNQGLEAFPTLNRNVAAEHTASAKGWAESMGYKYLAARTKEEFDANLEYFVSDSSDKPVIFEVFTKKEADAEMQHNMLDINKEPTKNSPLWKRGIKKVARTILNN